jgi:hypothetical protein
LILIGGLALAVYFFRNARLAENERRFNHPVPGDDST